eukprot:gene14305-15793_t
MAGIKSVLKCWKDFSLPEHQKVLDLEAIEIGNRQDAADKSRKRLVESTREFKKGTEDEIRKKVSPLIKALQSEVDQLSKRSKAAENSFLSLYKKLLEVPDPVPVLEQAQQQQQHLIKFKDLEIENQKLRETLDEYHVEFKEVKNQEVTIKELRERLKELEEKNEEKLQAKLKDRAKNLEKDFDNREKQFQEAQLTLASQLGEAESKVKELQKELSDLHGELFDVKSKSEEVAAARASEIDIIESDLERANQNRLSLEKYAESLKEQLTQALEARQTEATDEERLNQSLSSVTAASLEIQLTAKDREISQLVEEVHHLQNLLNKVRDSSKRESANLEEQLNERNAMLESMKKQLASQEDYDEIKRELKILKVIEFGEKEGHDHREETAPPKSLEKLLLEKSKALQSENTSLKVSKSDLNGKFEDLQKKYNEVNRTVKEQKQLITQLENDVLNLNSLSSTFRGQGEGEATPSAETVLVEKAVKESMYAENTMSNSEPDSLLNIISSQRERFRTKNLELESQTRHQQQQITMLQNEVDNIRSDNIKLYEKIKFLQSYPNQNTKVNVQDDSVSKYSSHYEERIDPFTAFSRKEKQRKYAGLSAPEKVTLNMGRFILSNKVARTIVFFYTILLHLLVFLVLYKMAYTESCKRDFAQDCAKKFAEHMNSFHKNKSN